MFVIQCFLGCHWLLGKCVSREIRVFRICNFFLASGVKATGFTTFVVTCLVWFLRRTVASPEKSTHPAQQTCLFMEACLVSFPCSTSVSHCRSNTLFILCPKLERIGDYQLDM